MKENKRIKIEKLNRKNALTNQVPQLIVLPVTPTAQTPPATVPKFAVNTYVSIIPDTSLRAYLCNKIQGIVCALNR